MIPLSPKTINLSTPPIIFLLILLVLRLSPSNSSPNPTNSNLSSLLLSDDPFQRFQQLRRAPHVFSKVLELPLKSDAEVSVEDRLNSLRFSADFNCLDFEDLRVVMVEPYPGIKKVLIQGMLHDELDISIWRTRLPENSCPEEVYASCNGGRLLVTVPKIN